MIAVRDGQREVEHRRCRTIAYFVNTYPAISHTFIRREIEALESLGWEVKRFAIRRSPDLVDERDKAECARTSFILPFRASELLVASLALLARPQKICNGLRVALQMARREERGFVRSMSSIPEAMVLMRRCTRLGILHVHVHFGTNPTTVLRVARAFGGPTYSFTNHGPAEIDNPDRWSLPDKVREASFVAVISNFGRAQLLGTCSESTWDKIHIIRCGLHFSRSDQQPTPVPATHQLLSIGRLSKEKGQLQLLRAVARVVETGIPLRLIVAGDGPMRPLLETEIDRLCLRGIVKLAGWVGGATVTDLLRSSRALVVSSFAEGLPIVLMECFQAGRPAIATNVGGIAELVEPGVSGWLVPPGDEARLAACMREVLTASPEQLTRMGQAGYARVQQMHDVRCEAQKLSDLLAEVTTGTAPARRVRPKSRVHCGEAARY